ncbi:MAG: hydrogen gas-evolving membrane-bound hydrogenase subunit E [Dehalococcoidia bacterium]
MGIFVIFTFAAAFAAVPLTRLAGPRVAGACCALAAGGWAVYLAVIAPGVLDGTARTGSFDWVPALGIRISWYIDGLALLMGLVVSGVGSAVLLYAGGYAKRDSGGRLLALLLAFVAAMMGLVTADNVVSLFVFWEATSLLSFLLIGFNGDRADARSAAQQAGLVTGAGGLALLAGLVLMGLSGGSWELSELRADGWRADGALGMSALCLVALGAFTKSAQFPFHFWLPNAMVAPSPVSAYLHSAAMVKAGVFVLARVFPHFEGLLLWEALLMSAGGTTAVLGGWFAIRHSDMKAILAYTTISLLGTLVFLLGIGTSSAVKAACVLLLGHALYKSSLFLAVGAVEHATGTRDVRELRGLARALPWTTAALALGGLSLAGLPPALGYVGKETLLAAAEANRTSMVLAVAGATGVFSLLAAWMVTLRVGAGSPSPAAERAHPLQREVVVAPLALAGAGLALGIAAPVLEPLVRSCATAITGYPVEVQLGLIPVSATVGIASVAIIVVGLTIAFAAGSRLLPMVQPGWPRAGDLGYRLALDNAQAGARFITERVQNGMLPSYVLTILVVTLALAGTAFVTGGGMTAPRDLASIRFHEGLISLVVLSAAGVAALTRSHMAGVAALGTVGIGIAVLYGMLGAPDLAMTQLLIETVTVVLFVYVFSRLPGLRELSSVRRRTRDAVFAGICGLFVMALTWTVAGTSGDRPVAEYFARVSYSEAFGRNVVNVIIVDFRALDTLAEITVLAVAAVGVLALLNFGRGKLS